ncbi:MAG: SpoIIE family protein phosphatase [Gaiella sp.]
MVAILAPLGATAIGLLLELEDRPGSVSIFVVAVMAAVIAAGSLAGIGAAAVSVVLLDWYFLPPTRSLFFTSEENLTFNSDSFTSIVILVVSVGLASAFLERARRARETAEALSGERDLAQQKTAQSLQLNQAANERTESLQRVTSSLLGAGTIDEVIDRALHEGVVAAGAMGGALGVIEADGQTGRLITSGIRSDAAGDRELRLLEADGVYGVASTDEALWLGSHEEVERLFPATRTLLESVHYESASIVPLVASGERIGFLACFYSSSQGFGPEQRAFLSSIAAQCAGALVRARLLHRARAARDRALRLQAVTAAHAGAATQETAGYATIDVGLPLFAASGGAVYVREDESLRLVAMRGYDTTVRSSWQAIPLEAETPVTRAARTREPVRLVGRAEMKAAFPHVYAAVEETSEHAMACVPLLTAGGTVVGALYVGFDEERRLNDDELALLGSLAAQCTQSLERARLLQAEQAEAARTLALQQVTASLSGAATAADVIKVAIDEGLATIGASWGAIGLVEPDGEHVRRFTTGYGTDAAGELLPLDVSLPGIESIGTGDAHWFTSRIDLEERYPEARERFADITFASMCALPMTLAGQRAGFIGAFFEDERSFTRDERTFVRTVADLCARALERARLLDAERIAVERVRRLQQVTAELAAAVTVEDVARVIVRQGIAAFGAAAGALVVRRGDMFETVGAVGYSDELLELYRRFSPDAPLVAAETMRAGAPRWVESLEEMQTYPAEELALGRGLESEAFVPLRFAGAVNGLLMVGFTGARRLTSGEKELLITLARQCARALESALVHERDHRIAETFQHSLMPDALPLLPTMRTAVRYLPGSDEAVVGGDWYDLIERGNCLFGGVGDVGGKGVVAASRMGQLRTALRAYGLGGMSPAEVLEHTNRLVEATESFFATLVALDLDLETGELRYSSAGHPPPLLLRSEGAATFLDGGRSVPFGVAADTVFAEDTVTLAPGDRLVVYTDGLVERRGEQLDIGLERLRDAFQASAGTTLELHVDRLLEAMLPGGERADDVAVLALEVVALTAPSGFAYRSSTDTAALRVLRGELREWLTRSGARDEAVEEIVLSASEAAANAIEHALRPQVDEFEVDARVDGDDVVLTIRDYGGWRAPRVVDERGRGILLMRALMDDVEIDEGRDGTRVTLRRRLL